MKLNHLNLAVVNVAATRDFFERYFDFRCVETKGEDVLSVLNNDSGFILILSNFDRKVAPTYPRDFHLGFILDGVEEVATIHQRLVSGGVEVGPPKSAHGSWGFYVKPSSEFTVEVATYAARG